MKATALPILCFTLICQLAFGQTISPNGVNTSTATHTPTIVPSAYVSPMVNHVRTWVTQKPITNPNDISITSAITDVMQQTHYMDGLGRPLQMVSKGNSPLGKDLVAPVVYDAFGRESYSYLPYTATTSDGAFKNDPFAGQASFMQSQYGAQGEIFFYGKTEFEPSPLNRTLKSMAAGNSWSGSNRGVEMSYEVNAANEVRIWNIDAAAGSVPASTSYYNAAELSRTITVDEHGKRVVEYKDKEGQVILKKVELTPNAVITSHTGWLSTYYVYNDLSQLRFVLSPKAAEQVVGSGTVANDIASELCFRYEYDQRGRMIVKKVPGAAEVFMVYDARDRLVFTQDGSTRSKNWWHVTLYDEINRPVMTGMMVYAGTIDNLRAHAGNENNLSGQTSIAVQGASSPANLSISSREVGRTLYQASSSIEFTDGFTSETGANFVAEIATGSSTTTTLTVMGNPLPLGVGFTALTQIFYDDYANTAKTYNTADNSKLDGGGSVSPETLPSTASSQTKGFMTSTKVWAMEDPNDLSKGKWLESASFYDEDGMIVQVQGTNIADGNETMTSMYDFTGKVICTYEVHNNPASTAGTIRIKTNIVYDHTGRLLTVKKQLNDAGTAKTILQNEYDEQGQLKNKKLGTDPNNSPNPLETLAYDYNIRGWLKGINKDYVNNTNSAHFFGQTLSYDYGFNVQQFNGNISGIQWRSKGDGEQRAYGFEYDDVNRLVKADFTQNNGGWNLSAGLDFSIGGNTNGKMQYDANGNILQMKQMGWKITGSTAIDNMQYSYTANSNKLLAVTEISNGTTDHKLGDFTDKNTSLDDYTYDVSGNLTLDKNKNISSITYNHLNLPNIITVTGKGTITYTYDATGNKLKKTVVEGSTTKTTTYIGGFIYEKTNTTSDELQFFAHEEGRVRKNTDGSFVFDYMIKDHLGNVRAVLTEEQKQDAYPAATMESSQSSTEEALYTNVNTTRNDLPAGYPIDNSYSNPNNKVAKTSGSGNKIGPAITLKVMAGDKFNLRVSSWYKLAGATPNSPNPIIDLATVLANGLGSVGGSKATTQALNSSGVLTPGATSFLNSQSYASSKPKAFVNWILFDEQFKYVSSSSGFDQVGNDAELKVHQFNNLAISKNGYLYVYVSNETPNIDVFFDNLQVTHVRGPLLEETHYYPFGLTMAGISSKALGGTENKRKFNEGTELENKEFSDGSGLELYSTEFRSYDPQIGRFHQIDPLTETTDNWSPYAFVQNNPLLYNDPMGLDTLKRNADGSLPTARPDGTSIQLGDFVENGKGPSIYWNGESWQADTKVLNRVTVRSKPKKNQDTDTESETPWMPIAWSQLGVKEKTKKPGNDGPQVEMYLKSAGLGPGYPWCGAFVNWCLKKAEIKGRPDGPAKALNWRKFGRRLNKPAYGSIATKTRKGGGHVGFVVGVTATGRVVLLGGNQGDMVKLQSFPASELQYNYPAGYAPNYKIPTIKAEANVKMH